MSTKGRSIDGWKALAVKYLWLSLKSKEKVVSCLFFFFSSALHTADTRLLSTPPDKKVHTGTSEMIWRRMASRTRNAVFSTVCS